MSEEADKKPVFRLPSWLLGEHLPSADQELRRRYRVQMSIGVTLIAVYLMYLSSIILFFDSYVWSLVFFAVPVFGVGLMIYLYRSGNVDLVGHGTCLLVLLGIGIPNFMTGGASGANAASMLILPVTALIVLDRWSLVWVGMSILLIMGFQVLDLMGFEFPQVIPPESQPVDTTITLIISSLVIPGVLWFSEIARRRAEATLLETKEKAESANRAKGQFLANMSHEFRTPLNGIIGLTELMLNREREPEKRHRMEMVRNSANNILTLVNDILDFSKVEENKLELFHEKFELRVILTEIVELLRVQAEQKGLKLHWQVSDHLPEHLVGDPKRFSQVVTNIIANAIKFTEKGSVRLSVDQGQIVDEDLELLVKVEDTGIGILPERQEAIFDAFTQADGSTTRRFGGSGLGLAISNKLIGLMGGEISVQSQPGHGSIFTFTAWFGFPKPASGKISSELTPAPVEYPIDADGNTDNGQPYRVLLVEDNDINQKMTKDMLKHLGHEVELASDGKEALDLVRDADYDLVLMDVQMPVMDGLAATKIIREMEKQEGRHTWIIAMTAHAMPGDREMCLEAGMDDYISKPMSMKELRRILARVGGSVHSDRLEDARVGGEEKKEFDILDYEELLSRTRGDTVLINELLDIFRQSSTDLLNAMQNCLEQRDMHNMGKAAHSLKGAASMMGAKRLMNTAQRVEQICRQGQEARLEEGVREVKKNLDELYPAIAEARARASSS